MIKPFVFDFLTELKDNNDRTWFEENKHRYVAAQQYLKELGDSIKFGIEDFDTIDHIKLYRIYRDIRFSKDKTPYKNNFGIYFKRATQMRRGGYYLNIEPGNVFVGGGFWKPAPNELNRIRQEFDLDTEEIEKIVTDPNFKKHFVEIRGEELKTAPRSYAKDHPNIKWLRKKQFLMVHNYTDEEAMRADFTNKVILDYKAMLPFHNYMSQVLTTDLNGELIV